MTRIKLANIILDVTKDDFTITDTFEGVVIVHKPTGVTVKCNDYATYRKNEKVAFQRMVGALTTWAFNKTMGKGVGSRYKINIDVCYILWTVKIWAA